MVERSDLLCAFLRRLQPGSDLCVAGSSPASSPTPALCRYRGSAARGPALRKIKIVLDVVQPVGDWGVVLPRVNHDG